MINKIDHIAENNMVVRDLIKERVKDQVFKAGKSYDEIKKLLEYAGGDGGV
jgi:hypothetical protein